MSSGVYFSPHRPLNIVKILLIKRLKISLSAQLAPPLHLDGYTRVNKEFFPTLLLVGIPVMPTLIVFNPI